jgi:hypothetical protein
MSITSTTLARSFVSSSQQSLDELRRQPPLRLCLVNLRLWQRCRVREGVLSANLRHQQRGGIVSRELDIKLLGEASEFLVCPHVSDLVLLSRLEAGNLAPDGTLGHGLVKRVHHEDVDSALGATAIELGGMGLVPGPGGVDPPFVGEGGSAPGGVLVEGKDLPVLENREVFFGD